MRKHPLIALIKVEGIGVDVFQAVSAVDTACTASGEPHLIHDEMQAGPRYFSETYGNIEVDCEERGGLADAI
jgi:hypothetical protein